MSDTRKIEMKTVYTECKRLYSDCQRLTKPLRPCLKTNAVLRMLRPRVHYYKKSPPHIWVSQTIFKMSRDFDDIDNNKPTITYKETHLEEECMYKMKILRRNGHYVYVWYRICVCGRFVNRQRDYEGISNESYLPNYHSFDGIVVHENAGCSYKTITNRGWCSTNYKITLTCYCEGNPGIGRKWRMVRIIHIPTKVWYSL